MAVYKEPCIHCGEFIGRDSKFCTKCGSRSPFGYHCPACLKPIERGDTLCSGCGRPLTVICPYCGGNTFAGSDKCGACGKTLMILCENSRCGEAQFFENKRCVACGKPIKKAKQQIERIRKGGI